MRPLFRYSDYFCVKDTWKIIEKDTSATRSD